MLLLKTTPQQQQRQWHFASMPARLMTKPVVMCKLFPPLCSLSSSSSSSSQQHTTTTDMINLHLCVQTLPICSLTSTNNYQLLQIVPADFIQGAPSRSSAGFVWSQDSECGSAARGRCSSKLTVDLWRWQLMKREAVADYAAARALWNVFCSHDCSFK